MTLALARYVAGAYEVRSRIFVRRPRPRVIVVLVPRLRIRHQLRKAA